MRPTAEHLPGTIRVLVGAYFVIALGYGPRSCAGARPAAGAAAFLLGTVAGPLLGAVLIDIDIRLPFLAYAALLVVAIGLSRAVPLGRALPGRAAPAVTGAAGFRAAFRHRDGAVVLEVEQDQRAATMAPRRQGQPR